MQNQKISRGGWDQHFGTVWCQPHSHKKTGVKKLLVGTSVFCAPGQQKKKKHKKWQQLASTQVPNNVQKSPRCAKHPCSFKKKNLLVFILPKSDFHEMAEVTFSYYHNNEDRTLKKNPTHTKTWTTFGMSARKALFLATRLLPYKGDASSW